MILERIFWSLLASLKAIRESAAEMAVSNNEDPNDIGTMAWYVFLLLSGFGFGALAVRWYWMSIPQRDYSFGGFVFILIAGIVFIFGYAVGASVLGKIGAALSASGRLSAGAGVIVLLYFSLVLPMRHSSMEVRQQTADGESAYQQSRLAAVSAQNENLPFVPPVSVPEMLEVERDGYFMKVTNSSGGELTVDVALVLPHGKLMDRCLAEVVVESCPNSSVVCAQPAGSGIPEAVAGVTSPDTRLLLAAGQTGTFITSHCEPRFADGSPEFQVWSPEQNRYLFKSESTLIPDYH